MDIPTRQDLQTLMESREGRHVSIFLPTDRTAISNQQDRVLLKNLLRDVENRLAAEGMRAPDVNTLLTPACALLENSQFWRQGSEGVALFLAPEVYHAFRVPLRFDPLIIVNKRFHIKPLLPLFSTEGRFYVLALSQNRVRLLEGSRYSVGEIDLENAPKSLADALKYDEFQRQIQFHTLSQTVNPSQGGERAGVFFGHSAGEQDEKAPILRYFQQINDGLLELLAGRTDPLVLAGVEYLHPIYREANKYRYLTSEGINGNPDDLNPQELHTKAWEIVEPGFDVTQKGAVELYEHLAGSHDPRATTDLRDVVPGAFYGRVDTLFICHEDHRWGHFDPATGAVEIHDEMRTGDEDLLDLAAAYTIINGGSVHAMGAPGERALAAILRY